MTSLKDGLTNSGRTSRLQRCKKTFFTFFLFLPRFLRFFNVFFILFVYFFLKKTCIKNLIKGFVKQFWDHRNKLIDHSDVVYLVSPNILNKSFVKQYIWLV